MQWDQGRRSVESRQDEACKSESQARGVRLENVRVKLKNVRLESVRPQRSLVGLSRRMTRQGICSCICLDLARVRSVTRQSINSSVSRDLKIIDSEMHRAKEGY